MPVHPGWGYYSAGASKFGGSGDFTTTPELGSLFAGSVANALAPVFAQLGAQARMLELGGGTGAFAEAVLLRLAELDALPSRYAILEPSADLRERQQQRLQQNLPAELAARVGWIDRPFEEDWEGVVFANEVIDALPTPRFLIRDGEVYEETVELDGEGNFIRGAQPADILLNGAVRHIERYSEKPFADGYRSEVLPQLPYWLQAVAGGLQRGAMLFVDYGYSRSEFYQHDRDDGTVARSTATTCITTCIVGPACRTSPRRWISPRWPRRACTVVSNWRGTAARPVSCSATAWTRCCCWPKSVRMRSAASSCVTR